VISHELRGGNVLLKTNLHPLGRIIETKAGVPQRLLSHPHRCIPTVAWVSSPKFQSAMWSN
jgi:hypothetical protein